MAKKINNQNADRHTHTSSSTHKQTTENNKQLVRIQIHHARTVHTMETNTRWNANQNARNNIKTPTTHTHTKTTSPRKQNATCWTNRKNARTSMFGIYRLDATVTAYPLHRAEHACAILKASHTRFPDRLHNIFTRLELAIFGNFLNDTSSKKCFKSHPREKLMALQERA